MKTITILLLFAINFLSVGKAQMLITPSETAYVEAHALLDSSEKKWDDITVSRQVDTSRTIFFEPRSEASRGRSTADIYRIAWQLFFDAHFENAGATKDGNPIIIHEVIVLTRLLGDKGYSSPKFTVEIAWRETAEGEIHTSTGVAAGPRYKGRGDRTKNPQAIHSANIAFYGAFMKAMTEILKDKPHKPTQTR